MISVLSLAEPRLLEFSPREKAWLREAINTACLRYYRSANCTPVKLFMAHTVAVLLCFSLVAVCNSRLMSLELLSGSAVDGVRILLYVCSRVGDFDAACREPFVWTDHRRATTSEGAAQAVAVRTSGSFTREAGDGARAPTLAWSARGHFSARQRFGLPFLTLVEFSRTRRASMESFTTGMSSTWATATVARFLDTCEF